MDIQCDNSITVHWHNFYGLYLNSIDMESENKILEGSSDLEKGAYLGAIASIASADRSASPEEEEYLSDLCDAADLSPRQKAAVIDAARDTSGKDLMQCLNVLKESNLKYSLLTDLMAFAKADGDYTQDEQQNVQKIAEFLEVDEKQTYLLDEFSDKAASSETPIDEIGDTDFLSSLGLKDKMKNAGINGNSLLKGLLAVAAPMIISRIVSRGRTKGNFGGGLLGGGGNMLGSGGLGSLIGMLSGGRTMNNAGGMFGRILGSR